MMKHANHTHTPAFSSLSLIQSSSLLRFFFTRYRFAFILCFSLKLVTVIVTQNVAEAVFSLEFCISILGVWNQRRFFLRTRDEDSALLIKTFLASLHFSLCLTSFQFFRGVWKYFPWCFPNPTSLQRDVCFRICDENYALLMKTFLSRWHFTKCHSRYLLIGLY